MLMAATTAKKLLNVQAAARDCAVDAARHVAHAAHEVRALETIASDAVETGVYAAKRAITRGYRDLEGLRDTAAYRVKRAPLVSVGLAFAAGILFGVVSRRCVGGAASTRRATAPTEW
jgi:hypothetical protein